MSDWVVLFSGVIIWGFVNVGSTYLSPPPLAPFPGLTLVHPAVSTNTARDVGARLMVLTIWGLPAGGGSYAAIAALANIPATLLGVAVQEYLLSDSSRGAYSYFPSSHLILHPRGAVHAPPLWAPSLVGGKG